MKRNQNKKGYHAVNRRLIKQHTQSPPSHPPSRTHYTTHIVSSSFPSQGTKHAHSSTCGVSYRTLRGTAPSQVSQSGGQVSQRRVTQMLQQSSQSPQFGLDIPETHRSSQFCNSYTAPPILPVIEHDLQGQLGHNYTNCLSNLTTSDHFHQYHTHQSTLTHTCSPHLQCLLPSTASRNNSHLPSLLPTLSTTSNSHSICFAPTFTRAPISIYTHPARSFSKRRRQRASPIVDDALPHPFHHHVEGSSAPLSESNDITTHHDGTTTPPFYHHTDDIRERVFGILSQFNMNRRAERQEALVRLQQMGLSLSQANTALYNHQQQMKTQHARSGRKAIHSPLSLPPPPPQSGVPTATLAAAAVTATAIEHPPPSSMQPHNQPHSPPRSPSGHNKDTSRMDSSTVLRKHSIHQMNDSDIDSDYDEEYDESDEMVQYYKRLFLKDSGNGEMGFSDPYDLTRNGSGNDKDSGISYKQQTQSDIINTSQFYFTSENYGIDGNDDNGITTTTDGDDDGDDNSNRHDLGGEGLSRTNKTRSMAIPPSKHDINVPKHANDDETNSVTQGSDSDRDVDADDDPLLSDVDYANHYKQYQSDSTSHNHTHTTHKHYQNYQHHQQKQEDEEEASSSPPPSKFRLNEHDLDERFVRGHGPGGQAINKTKNCVLLQHIPTGIIVKCQQTRFMHINRAIARKILTNKVEAHHHGRDSYLGRKAERIQRRKERHKRRRSSKAQRAIAEIELLKKKLGLDQPGDDHTTHPSSAIDHLTAGDPTINNKH